MSPLEALSYLDARLNAKALALGVQGLEGGKPNSVHGVPAAAR
jgi:hypothetical protein